MKTKIALIFAVLAVILAACAPAATIAAPATAAPAPESVFRSLGSNSTSEQAMPAAPAPSASGNAGGAAKTTDSATAAQARMIAMSVDLNIVVVDPQKKSDAIYQMAKSLGGYLVSENMSQVYASDGTSLPQGTISIRVPADQLDYALSQIKAGVVTVQSENRSGNDVTSQYVDLQSQLTNLQKAEQDLQAIMDEAKNNPGNDSTTKTQDVLNVYNQIVSIRGQIEQIQGQMKYLSETTSTAAINVTLIAEQTVKPITSAGWKPLVVVNESAQDLVKFLQGFVNVLIRLVILAIPVLIVIFGPIALIVWGITAIVKRRKARKAAAQAK